MTKTFSYFTDTIIGGYIEFWFQSSISASAASATIFIPRGLPTAVMTGNYTMQRIYKKPLLIIFFSKIIIKYCLFLLNLVKENM